MILRKKILQRKTVHKSKITTVPQQRIKRITKRDGLYGNVQSTFPERIQYEEYTGIFGKTAATHSWNVAVDDGSVCLTWSELLDLSKSIGTAFCKKTEMQKPIVLLLGKSAVTLVAMFGTVYAGCFYVIIDPMQPSERIREILHTLSPGIVVTTKGK